MNSGEVEVMSELKYQNVGDSDIAYYEYGCGEPLLLIHGYPLNGFTFRKLLPSLASRFRCYVLDLPGAGASRWTATTDFGFRAQAQGLKIFADRLGMRSYSLLSHDTGGTIARQLSIIDPQGVYRQVIIGSEIPNHRPPWIRFFQFSSLFPGANSRLRRSMNSPKFLHSAMGFGGCFFDPLLIDGDFHQLFVQPMLDSEHVREGQIYRLRGIDWKVVDSLAKGHGQIQCPVLLIWGEEDPVFPLEKAKHMVAQFRDCRGLIAVPQAKLFVHEEQPEIVAKASLDFLLDPAFDLDRWKATNIVGRPSTIT